MGRPERPLDPAAGPVAAFASELRRLRAEAGLSYRELALRCGFSPSVLSGATSGFRLPSLRVTQALVAVCHGDVGQWTRRWREAAASLTGRDDLATNPMVDACGALPPAARQVAKRG
ncbi:helix-turn-helix domain-containing protein [Micromonospora sp. NPDC051925]|uniref:helix-turn-helix domain-containing protein n=1 Tax=Micromonospora sp. NPDC051925 TaxID=3364288 RepID=UPI0037CB4D9F